MAENGPRTLRVDDQLEWGGGQQQVLYLCEGLSRRGLKAALCFRAGSELGNRAVSLNIPAVLLARLIRGEGYEICHAHTSQ